MPAFPTLKPGLNKLAVGVYQFTSRVLVPQDAIIEGPDTGTAELTGRTSDGEFLYVRANNVQIRKNLTFRNGGIFRDGRVSNLVVEWCKFLGRTTGVHKAAISSYVSTGLTIRNNYFEDVNYGCWCADESDLDIHNNELTKSGYGFKVFGDGDNSEWHAWYNWIHDVGPDFMGYEWQGRCRDWTLESNLSERIAIGPTKESNDHTLFHSLPMAKSDSNGRVRFNVLLGTPPNNGLHIPMAFEVGGGVKGDSNREVLYQQNFVNGANNAYDVTDRDSTARIRFKDNFAANVNKVISQNSSTQEVIQEGQNGPSAPPPVGYTTWADFIAALRMKVGRQGMTVPPEPPVETCLVEKARIKELEAALVVSSQENARLNLRIAGKDQKAQELLVI